MPPTQRRTLHTGTLIVATVLLGISWSFAIFHIRTAVYPLLWAAALPFLAFAYVAGDWRVGTWKHLPAAAVTLYAVVLWRVSQPYGRLGMLSAVAGIAAAGAALWLGSRLAPRQTAPLLAATGRSRGAGRRRPRAAERRR